ncbi:MAG TPA: glycosyltransferase family 87 protein [Solirubrobacteraceae bacterium]|nr:glycosyltransferase family 87 protein [Solirubrobacteraceae bacterium]
MRDDVSQGELPAVPGAVASVGAGSADTSIVLPRLALAGVHLPLPRPGLRVSRRAYGLVALGAMVAGCAALAAFASAGPSVLAPGSWYAFPGWVAGPLYGLLGDVMPSPTALNYGLSGLIVALSLAYAVALAAARLLSMRAIVVAVVALHAVLLLSPPLALTDLFNYLGYARLGALHHLNPYTHVIAAERHDPVYWLSTWHHLHSPYGPAFTLLSYPLGVLPLPAAYWVLKAATVAASLGFIALVGRCARQLGRDPRVAVLFVAANPIFLIYELGGFHNDVFMLIPAMAAISLLLDGRDRRSGAALMLAVAVKFTMVLLLPFLLLAARPPRRRARLATGAALAAVPLAAASVAAFGLALPNVEDQTTILTSFSVPNVVGLLLGLGGGAPMLVRAVNVALVVVVAILIVLVARGRRDWLSAAGFATVALIASLAWLMPWYVVWLLPLAAIAAGVHLRRATLVATAFLVLTFLPATGMVLAHLHLDPMNTAVGQISNARAQRLEQ